MSGSIARQLLRLADSLQRRLFDDDDAPVGAAGGAAPVAIVAAPPAPAADPSRHPFATREIVLDGRRIAFQLKRTRRRSIGFVVGREGLVVSAPRWVALRDIDAAAHEKAAWIVARLAEQRERSARLAATRVVWAHGAVLMHLGRPICIELDSRHGLAAGEVVLDADAAATGRAGAARSLRVGLPHGAAPDRLRDAVQSWLQREARAVFEARCRHFAAQLGVRVTRLTLSSAETRWGSASASGAVRLNWRLIHFPMATIDYVVAHELAHLREMNHSARFWDVVRSVVPEYEAARQRLREEGIVALD